jgi:putative phosphoesterase
MLVGAIADTHDNLPKVAAAAELFAERGVELILHAGDFVAPFVLKVLKKPGIPIVGVFGNNDGERAGLRTLCEDIHEPPHRLQLDGRTIVIAHDLEQLEAVPGDVDLLVHGHTHEPQSQPGKPLLLNPGEAGGWLTGRGSAALVDMDRMQVETVDLGSQETVPI